MKTVGKLREVSEDGGKIERVSEDGGKIERVSEDGGKICEREIICLSEIMIIFLITMESVNQNENKLLSIKKILLIGS